MFWNCIKQADDEVVKMEVIALPKSDYWFDVKCGVNKKFHKNMTTLILLFLANINSSPTFQQSNIKEDHISLRIKSMVLGNNFQEWMKPKIQQSLFWNCISIKQADDEVVKMEVFPLPKCDYWFDVKCGVNKKFHKNLTTLILLDQYKFSYFSTIQY